MTARIGDEIMIISRESHQPVREGQIREVRNDPGGVVYLVQWSDTLHESLLPHGPDVVIQRRHTPGSEATAARDTSWRSRLRHPLEWHHKRDLERGRHIAHERLAMRVEEILIGCGLVHEDYSIAAGRVFPFPRVVSVTDGPPLSVDVHMLPGQSPDDFSAHAAKIAYDLGMAEVRTIPLGPSRIRLELLPVTG
ncbi:MAG: DUF1918 domain-containing protein [Pseudonocardiaceae bacterium]